jgi:hypothetical protein
MFLLQMGSPVGRFGFFAQLIKGSVRHVAWVKLVKFSPSSILGICFNAKEASLPGNRSPKELPLLRPIPFPVGSSMLFRLGPALGYAPKAACL